MTQPKYATQDSLGRRIYRDPASGKRVPSVTTVIRMLNKPALMGWYAKQAAQYAEDHWSELAALEPAERVAHIAKAADRTKDDAGDKGDSVHIFAEAWLKGEPIPSIRPDMESAVAALFGWFDRVKPRMLASEVSVWSETGYAGTFDLLAEIDGEIWLLDYKTGKGIYPEVGLQLAALGACDRVISDGLDVLPKIDRYGAVHIRPDELIDGAIRPAFALLVEIEKDSIPSFVAAFQACLTLYQWEPAAKKALLPEVA